MTLAEALEDVTREQGETVRPGEDVGEVGAHELPKTRKGLGGDPVEGDAKSAEGHKDTANAVTQASDIDGGPVNEERRSGAQSVPTVVFP